MLLEDGAWHASADVMPIAKKLAKCEAETVTRAHALAGVEVRRRNRPDRSGRLTEWRLARRADEARR